MSSQPIAALREKFEVELQQHADLYHPTDIARVRTDDWQVKRFLLAHPDDETKAFENLIKALQWKKSFGIHDRTDTYFPREWWEMSGAEISGRDKAGHLVHWGMLRRLIKFKNPKARLLTQQFMAHITERLDVAAGESGYVIIADATGGGVSNVDIDNVKFIITILEFYPHGMRSSYTVNLPWILNSLMKLIMTFMPAKLKELVHFVTTDELPAVVDPKYIPAALKGSREKTVYPVGLVSVEERYQELELDEKVLSTFKNMSVE